MADADEATSEVETEETTSQEELSEEVATEEPSEETEEATSQEEPSEPLYAGKFKTVEELEKAYNLSSSEGKDTAGEMNALRQEVERMKLSPEERDVEDQNLAFIKRNGLVTKAELEQIEKDQREAKSLMEAGATQLQIDNVMEAARYGSNIKKSLTEVYRKLYGIVPKRKPNQGATQKPRGKSVRNKQFTQAELDGMSQEDFEKNYARLYSEGVQS